jgi:hypothetical protein
MARTTGFRCFPGFTTGGLSPTWSEAGSIRWRGSLMAGDPLPPRRVFLSHTSKSRHHAAAGRAEMTSTTWAGVGVLARGRSTSRRVRMRRPPQERGRRTVESSGTQLLRELAPRDDPPTIERVQGPRHQADPPPTLPVRRGEDEQPGLQFFAGDVLELPAQRPRSARFQNDRSGPGGQPRQLLLPPVPSSR